MSLIELLHALKSAGCRLEVEGDQLRVRGHLPKDLRAEVLARKPELLSILGNNKTQVLTYSPRNIGQRFKAHNGQRGIWVISQQEGAECAYVEPGYRYYLKGELSISVLEDAFNYLVERHEIMRTTYHFEDDVLWQRIEPNENFSISLEDLRHLSPEEKLIAEQEILEREANTPFDLATDRMLRATLVRLGEDEYLLFMVMHHIAMDGWSWRILTRELEAVYNAYIAGKEAPLSPLTYQYGDYVAWREKVQFEEEIAPSLAYWEQELKDVPPLLQLPLDQARSSSSSYSSGTHTLTFSSDQTMALNQLARDQGVTLYTLLNAIFAVVLSRYSGEKDIVVGSPFAGRKHIDFEDMVGFFVNTLALRMRWNGNPLFSEWLSQAHHIIKNAEKHQTVPFDVLVDALQVSRSHAYSPIFQVMLVLLNMEIPPLKFEKVRQQSVKQPVYTNNKYDLSLICFESEDSLTLSFEFNLALFNRETITQLAESFNHATLSILNNPNQPISRIDLFDEQTQSRLLNANVLDSLFSGWCLHHKFEEQVVASPESSAVHFGDQTLTYDQLNRCANTLAKALIDKGVARDTPVGLCLDRTPNLIIAVIAVMKAGGCYVSLDPRYPPERLQYILNDSGCQVVLTEEKYQSLFSDNQHALLLSHGWEEASKLNGKAGGNLNSVSVPSQLSHLIYTSGSTGQPKGVMIEHRNVAALMEWTWQTYQPEELSKVLFSTSLNFDLSVFEIWAPLLSGGSVVVVQDISELVERSDLKPTLINTVPSALDALISDNAIPQTVMTLNVAGEPLSKKRVNGVFSTSRVNKVYNLYGPSEDTTYSTYSVMEHEQSMEPTIGTPISFTKAYVFGEDMALVPDGVIGELYLSGGGVCRGYHNKGDLTQASFVINPYALESGEILYKTGDLVCRRDCELVYVGRRDNQVKVRGHRIELGEIESVLNGLKEVEDQAVIKDSESGHLVAYLVLSSAAPLKDAETHIQRALASKVPSYMMPALFEFLDAMPMTANGKIDRQALPLMVKAKERFEPESQLPRSTIEKTIMAIWQSVLPNGRFGVNCNFFKVGGDSIIAIQLAAKARRSGLDMNSSFIFSHQTIAEQALHVYAVQPNSNKALLPAEGEQQFTPIMQAFLDLDDQHVDHFNQSMIFDVPQLEEAQWLSIIEIISRRHDVFRLAFDVKRRVGEYLPFDSDLIRHRFSTLDLRGLSPRDVTSRLSEKTVELQTSLSISDGNHHSVLLIKRDERDQLLWVMHHMIIDGVGWRILEQELHTLCTRPGQIESALPVPCGNSLQQWSGYLASEQAFRHFESEIPYWQAELDVPSILPSMTNSPAVESTTQYVTLHLSEQKTEPLLSHANHAYGTKPNELMLAALATVLSDWTAQPCVRIELEGHGRDANQWDVEQTLGWLTSLYPVSLPRGTNVKDHIVAVKEKLRAIPSKGLGYGVLRYVHRSPKLDQHDFCADVVFNYLGQFSGDSGELNAELAGLHVSQNRQRQHKLGINALIRNGEFTVRFDFSTDHFSKQEVAERGRELLSHLSEIIEHCLNADRVLTPSDFPLATLDVDALSSELVGIGNIDDLYPVTPTQQGMLFHASASPDAGMYTNVLELTLNDAKPLAFKQSWQALIARHDILRTRFVALKSTLPHQVVCDTAPLDWQLLDWREQPFPEESVREYIENEKKIPISPDAPSLMRFTLIRLSVTGWRFIWTFHHSILDGWSIAYLLTELKQIYDSHEPALPAPVPFWHYVKWQREQSRSQAETYWRSRLADLDNPCRIVPVRSLADLRSVRTDKIHISTSLGESLSDKVNAFAHTHALTTNVVFQGAIGILLSKYANSNDIVFGQTVSGRAAPLDHIDSIVGPCLTTVPVRLSLPEKDVALASWLQDVQLSTKRDEAFSYAGLRDINTWSQHESQLFDCLVVFENYPSQPIDSEEVGTDALRIMGINAFEENNFPVSIVVLPERDICIHLDFDPNYLSKQQASAVLHQLTLLIETMLASGSEPVSSLSLMNSTDAAIHSSVSVKDTPVMQTCIHHKFEQAVEAFPDTIALVYEEHSVSYKELNRNANRLAKALIQEGVKPDDLVGLHAERSIELVIGILGILKAGGAYVPLDPHYPEQRLQYIEQDAKLRWIVSDQGLKTNAKMIPIGQPANAHEEDSNPVVENLKASNLAYVIYTSGSTGNPKGVMVEHRNVERLFSAADTHFSFDDNDVWTLFHSYAFDFSVWELWGALAYGGRLIIVGYEQSRSPELFYDVICQHGVTVLNQTPSAFYSLSSLVVERDQPTALRYVIFGGEALDFTALKPWFSHFGDTQPQLVNMYGITETTVHVTYQAICEQDCDGTSILIGVPLQDLTAFVCDHYLNVVPAGVPGELLVSGGGVTRGYLHRPELNNERFISHPFIKNGGKVYRSGDLVRQRPCGNLEYLGRIDQQVKIRGYRIELGEIESCIRTHNSVQQTAVLTEAMPNGHQKLVAFVEPVEPSLEGFSESVLRVYLHENMPEYMVPSDIVVVPNIPLTANGKTDQRALLTIERFADDRVIEPPRTELESVLLRAVTKVLQRKDISMGDGFFAIGGDSILALQLIGLLNVEGFALTVSDLFNANILTEVAKRIRATSKAEEQPTYAPFSLIEKGKKTAVLNSKNSVVDAYPASVMQEGMVFLQHTNQHTDLYLDVFAFRSSLPWQEDAFRRALQMMVTRHELLRTSFWLDPEDGQYLQLVYKNAVPQVTVHDCYNVSEEDIHSQIAVQVSRESSHPLDYSEQSLMRVGVYPFPDHSFAFILTFSHAILDGWSVSKFNTELFQTYQSILQGKHKDLGESPLPYYRFIKQEIESREDVKQKAFWQQHLADAPVTSFPSHGNGKNKVSHFNHQLTPLIPALKAFAAQLNVPLQHVLFAGHIKALSLMSGETDVLSCMVSNSRPEAQNSELSLGLFLNTLPIRCHVNRSSWVELVKGVSAVVNDCFAHRFFPFADIQQHSRTKFDQILFNFTHFHSYDEMAASSDIRLSFLAKHEASEFAWVAQFMQVAEDDVVLELQHSDSQEIRHYALALAECYELIFKAMVEQPNQPHIGVYDHICAEQQTALLDGGVGESEEDKRFLSLPEMIEEQVRLSPHRTAVICDGKAFSYDELNRRANTLAHYLRSQGIHDGQRISVLLDRSFEMVVALLGVMKAGAAYIPLDPSYPEERLVAVLEDAECVMVIANEGQFEQLRKLTARTKVPICFINRLTGTGLQDVQEENLPFSGSKISPAYVIYTSGSTGKPKGVLIEHGALSNFILAVKARYQTNKTSHTLALTTVSFDIAALELFLPLISGARCVITTREERLQGSAIQQLIEEHDVQIMQATPTGYQFLLDSEHWTGNTDLILLCGGEALPITLAEKLLRAGKELWNQYGPTEATVWVTAAQVSWQDLQSENGYVSISGWLANCSAVVLNPLGEILPKGVPGELHLAGANLARGYYNRPSLTDSQFIERQLPCTRETRWYKTGDLVRLDGTGKLIYLSRLDHQVKIRGHRIELGEIESLISQYTGIQTSTVIADKTDSSHRILAYVIAKELTERQDTLIEKLKADLKRQLPDYMVPDEIIVLEEMPLTPNGKVDRKKLPQVKEKMTPTNVVYATETQRQLALIWQDLLDLKAPPPLETDFFEIGGHSLLAVKLAAKVRTHLNVEIAIDEIFRLRTLSAIDAKITQSGATFRPALVKVNETSPTLAGYAQQRIWFIEQLPNGRGVYNMPMTFELKGELDTERLQAVLKRRVERFTSLRTTFKLVDAQLFTERLPADRFNVNVEDISTLVGEEFAATRAHHHIQVANEPFDLEEDYPLRATLLRLSQDHFELLLTMHHIVSDGWSWGVFIHEINLDYNHEGDSAILLPSLPYDMVDFSSVQHTWIESEKTALHDYWSEYLGGIPALHSLSTDFPRPVTQDFRGKNHLFKLSSELTQELKALCDRESVTLFMLLQTAFSVLLSRYSGETDIVMGTPVAGRDYSELEPQIGLFVNTMVVRTDLSGNPTGTELLARSKDSIASAMAHQHAPFEWLVETLSPERSTSYSPLFQIMFALQSMRSDTLELDSICCSENLPVETKSRFDLSLYCREENGEIGAIFEYATSLFSESTIVGMALHFETLLWSMVENADKPILALPILNLTQQSKMLAQWNDTDKKYDTSRLIHQIFEQQAKNNPDTIAITFESESVTYHDLNERANRVAHYLIDKVSDAYTDALVGVCLPRSIDMVVSLLAIMKAGMAYVPVDPNYPQQRIEYMLSDSEVPVVLTYSGILDAGLGRIDICLDDKLTNVALSQQPLTNPDVTVDLGNLAYVIYTSGSTGNPKGVMIEHGAILNRLAWMQDAYALMPSDRVLQKTPFSFDVSVWEFFWPLMYGARLVVAKPEGHKDSTYLAELIMQEGITVLHFVPSMLQLFVEESRFEQCQTLRYVFCSGEALPFELQQRFYDLHTSAELHNLYGPTEAAVDVTYWKCERNTSKTRVPIGRPITNMQVVVLDEQLMPVPVNVPGELYLSGVGLARGYLNKPDLTRAAFIPSPFEGKDRLYKTGDKVRWLKDGTIEYLGRLDHQIKLRGFRIELGEIESALCELDKVREAVVLLDSSLSSPALVAYAVPNQDENLSPEILRETLRSRLPEHLVPAYFVVIKQMPLTPNGKLDRKALPKPQQPEKTRFRLPETAMESWVSQIWEELLTMPCSTDQNFFSTGGNSLLALRLITQVKQRYPNLPLSVQTIFEYQTIATFAAVIEQHLTELGERAVIVLDTPDQGIEDLIVMEEEF